MGTNDNPKRTLRIRKGKSNDGVLDEDLLAKALESRLLPRIEQLESRLVDQDTYIENISVILHDMYNSILLANSSNASSREVLNSLVENLLNALSNTNTLKTPEGYNDSNMREHLIRLLDSQNVQDAISRVCDDVEFEEDEWFTNDMPVSSRRRRRT